MFRALLKGRRGDVDASAASKTHQKQKEEGERAHEAVCLYWTNLLHLSQLWRALILNAIKMYVGLNAFRCFLCACKDVFGNGIKFSKHMWHVDLGIGTKSNQIKRKIMQNR